MVLSLGFILAFIGAAVALLIGILIFSEVSDSIICPAPGSPATPGVPAIITGFDNTGSFGASGDASYSEADSPSTFVVTTGIIGQGVIKNGTSDLNTNGQIHLGTDPATWEFLNNIDGSNLTSINFWINGDFVGSPWYPIMNTGNGAFNSQPGINLMTQSGTNMLFQLRDQSGHFVSNQVLAGGIPADDSNWHMLTLIMDRGNTTGTWVRYCLDGTCNDTGIQTNPFLAGIDTPGQNFTFGGDSTFAGSVTQNTILWDDITIWHGWLLTQAQVNTMWNGGAGSSGGSIATGTQVVHVSFDVGTEIGTGGGAGSPGSSGQGNTECENAKDTAWTVIGILPVALFFALFAIFGALGRNN